MARSNKQKADSKSVAENIRVDATKQKPAKQSGRKRPQAAVLPRHTVMAASRLFWQSLKILWDNWRLFSVMLLIYAGVYLVLVGGLSGSSSVTAIKNALHQSGSHVSSVSAGAALFSTLISSGSSSSNPGSGVYQSFLILIMSVVLIWALRQLLAGHAIRARDAFYQGVYPLIPFILVLLVVGAQLVPLIIGAAAYSMLVGGGVLIGFVQVCLAFVLLFALAVVSIYWICSSLFALYIVTLPDMTPLRALRSARELVKGRRWLVIRKILFLPLMLLVIAACILLPVAIFVAPLAAIVLLVFYIVALAVVHSYIYSLYRELL